MYKSGGFHRIFLICFAPKEFWEQAAKLSIKLRLKQKSSRSKEMRRLRLSVLPEVTEGHIFKSVLPGEFIYRGGLSFMEPGQRSHSNDGPDGRDYHVHEDCEAFLVLDGQGLIEVNKVIYPIQVGEIIIIEPGEDHHLISESNHLVTLWCHAGPLPHYQMKRQQ